MSNINSENYANHLKTSANGRYRNLEVLITNISRLPERGDIYRGLEGRGIRKKAENLIARWNREDSLNTVNTDIVPLVAKVEEEYKFENGLEVPVGTTFKIGSAIYKVGDFKTVNNVINISLRCGSLFKSLAGWYTVAVMNQSILTRSWQIEDVKIREIPRVKKFLDSYTNVIKSEAFKSSSQTAYNGAGINLNPGVTGNCQLTTICQAQNLINNSSDIPLQFKEIAKKAGRRIVLMDIKQIYVKKLKDNIKEGSILLSENYKSTNGSSMHIILIDTGKV